MVCRTSVRRKPIHPWYSRSAAIGLVLGLVLGAAVLSGSASPSAIAAAVAIRPSSSGVGLGQSPPYLQQMSMVDDGAMDSILSFGGIVPNSGPTDWTLTFQNGSWTNLTPVLTELPPARYGASMVYDPVDREAVLFGGCLNAACFPALNDTWVFSGGSWSQIQGPSPPGRGFAAMTWDWETGYAVLFGGSAGTASSAKNFFNDTWSFVNNRWTNLTAAQTGPTPSPRHDASFASNPITDPILFGGSSASGWLNDTWTFTDGRWFQVTTAASPSPREGAAFSGNPNTGVDYLFGGYDAGAYLADTWTYSTGSWTRLSISGPPGTFGAGFAWDPTSSRFILYGGAVSENGQTGATNAFWTFNGASWSIVNPPAAAAFPWIAIIPLVIIGALIPLRVIIVIRQRRVREAGLASLLPEPPAGSITWYPSEPPGVVDSEARKQMLRMFAIFVPIGAIFTPIFLLAGINFAAVIGLTVIWAFFLVLPPLSARAIRRNSTRRLGLFDAGIVIESAARIRRIPWENIQPPAQVSKGPWVTFPYSIPGKQPGSVIAGRFTVTRDQARVILSSPRAMGWNVAPPIRSALGLQPPTLGSSVMAPPMLAPGFEANAAAQSGLYAGSVPLASAAAGSVPLQSQSTVPPRWCTRCGSRVNPGTQFCNTCGARVV